MHALVSIHDVMPETLDRVRAIVDFLPAPCRQGLTLLVVPGKDWQQDQLTQLHQWQQQGYLLAGHGWHHTIEKFGGFYHRLHGALLSRRAAEHLALTEAQILDLMQRCFDWFDSNGLQSPDYYVPPAWALGFVDIHKLQSLPWEYLEVTGGIYRLKDKRRISLPLTGFEADTWLRAGFLQCWNAVQASLATEKRPLRISLHPDDPALKVAQQMHRLLNRVSTGRSYHSLFSD